MQDRLKGRLSLLLLAFALMLAMPAMALADLVTVSDANSLQASGDTSKQAGQTGTARFHLLPENKQDDDPVGGCNATTTEKVKVAVNSTAKDKNGNTLQTSPVTFADPGFVELEGCDDTKTTTIENAKTLGYTVTGSAQVGDVITVQANASGGRSPGGKTGSYSTDTFTITVIAAPEQGTSLNVSPASGTYGGGTTLSAKLTSGSTNLNDRQVAFKLNGQSVGSATTDSNGVATLQNVSLGNINAGGPYVDAVTANYAGTGANCASNCFGPSDGKNTLTVNKADLTVTTDNKSKTYGQDNPAFTGGITGIKNSDNITASRASEATASSPVRDGGYPITATLSDPGNKLGNYNVTNNGGTLTINARPITVTADAKSKTYGQNDPNLTYQVTSENKLVGTDGFTGALTRQAGENVGNYAIQQGTLSAGGNYALTFNGANLAIGTKELTGSFTAPNKEYDGNASASITGRDLTGVVGNDNVSLDGGSATFGDKKVGDGKTVTGTGFTLSGAQAGNYTLSMKNTATANITPKSITGSFTASNKEYDGNVSATVTGRSLNGAVTGDAVSLSGGTATFANKNAGTGKTVTLSGASLTGTDAGNYTLSSVETATADITAKGITGSFTASNKEYDGNVSATVTGRSLSGAVQGDVVSLSGGTATFANKVVGTGKTVTLSGATLAGADAGNYNLTSVGTTTADITPKSLTGGFTASNKVYDGNTDATIATSTLNGVVEGDVVTLTGSEATFDNANAGTGKTVTVGKGDLSGAQAANYTLAQGPWTAQANITPRPITVTADAQSKVYGQADPVLSRQVTSGSLVQGESLNGSLTREQGENVGTYAIRQGTLTAGDNYNLTFVGDNLTITKKQLTVTAANAEKIYGEANPAFHVIYDGFVANEGASNLGGALAFITEAKPASAVGNYPVTPSGLTAANYNITFKPGTLTVMQRPITVTADAQSKVYGQNDPALSYKLTSGSLVNGDAFTGGLARAAGETVAGGPYAIRQGTLTAGNNYNLTFVGDNLTITKREITVTADAGQSKVYGQADPALTYKLTDGSLGFNDTLGSVLNGSLAREQGENVGPYAIRPGTLAANGNYNLTVTVAGTDFAITKRPISVKADPQSKVYGQNDPALTYKVTSGNLVGTDAFTGSLDRQAGENVGTYAIQRNTLTAGNNYNLTFNGDNLTITKRAVEVTADAKSKVLGAADPALTYKVTSGNLVGTDAFTGSLDRQAGENVGTYAIQRNTLTAGNNYDLGYVGANLKIEYAPVGTSCLGAPGHTVLQPINTDGSSVFKQGSTVPVKFRVCDANGNSIGTPGVVTAFQRTSTASGTVSTTNEEILSTTPDTAFRWSAADQQWIFNLGTTNLSAGTTYTYQITLNDGTVINFKFGLRK